MSYYLKVVFNALSVALLKVGLRTLSGVFILKIIACFYSVYQNNVCAYSVLVLIIISILRLQHSNYTQTTQNLYQQ